MRFNILGIQEAYISHQSLWFSKDSNNPKKNTDKRKNILFLTSAALKIIYKEHNENKHTRDLIF